MTAILLLLLIPIVLAAVYGWLWARCSALRDTAEREALADKAAYMVDDHIVDWDAFVAAIKARAEADHE
jgi:lipopolysaccharide biosynthesis regulator YciM